MFVLGHRPALDGVRGIAIIMVVASHTPWSGFDGGGFVGVPLFFVLSGFLITTLLLEEHRATGAVDLKSFYLRRAYRLLPAIVVLAAASAAYMAATGQLFAGLRNAAASVFYVANLLAASDTDMPFLEHTWSLSLEEQFYVLWPLLLLVLLRRGTRLRWIITGLALAAAASGLVRLALWADEATNARLHYGPDTRADAILIGCLLAFAIVRWHRPLGLRWLAVGGLGLIGTFVWVDERDVGYPYGLTVIALVAAAFTAWAVLSPDRQHSWLEHPALVRVGRLSYGLYLWHYPILQGGDSVLPFLPDPWRTIVLVAASWVAAELSWLIVETPFLRRKARLSHRRDAALPQPVL